MSNAETRAWVTALSITPQELMTLYQETGELSDLHRELYAGFQGRGQFACIRQEFFFYSAAADLHTTAYLAEELSEAKAARYCAH